MTSDTEIEFPVLIRRNTQILHCARDHDYAACGEHLIPVVGRYIVRDASEEAFAEICRVTHISGCQECRVILKSGPCLPVTINGRRAAWRNLYARAHEAWKLAGEAGHTDAALNKQYQTLDTKLTRMHLEAVALLFYRRITPAEFWQIFSSDEATP